jgi:hypothetical protein
MGTINSCVSLVVAVGLCVHCSTGPSEPRDDRSSLHASHQVVSASSRAYQHLPTSSKLHLGANVRSDVHSVYERTLGEEGVFATNSLNGMVIGTQNAGSSALKAGPYSLDMSTHSEYVKSYFLSAGVPADQVLGVVGSTKTIGSGQNGSMATITTVGYEATLSRSLSGFHVAESFAEAQVNANGEVVRESVYWPAIPLSVVADATAIASLLNDPVRGPQYLSRLPVQGTHRVRLHHTSGFIIVPTPFVSFASCDVLEHGGIVHHFDISGTELILAQEVAPTQPPRQQGS